MLRTQVIVVQSDHDYVDALRHFYEQRGENEVIFTTNLISARGCARAGRPFVLIMQHRPDLPNQDACRWAETLKRDYPQQLQLFLVYSINEITDFSSVDGWIKKPIAHMQGWDDLCAIIDDLVAGMGKEALFQKYSSIAHR